MGANIIDPENASADLDALTLTRWELSSAPSILLEFAGGLGRIDTPEGTSIEVDPLGTVTIERALPPGATEDSTEVSALLDRWQNVGTPLRLLEFSDTLMVVEDGENYLALPPGPMLGSATAID